MFLTTTTPKRPIHKVQCVFVILVVILFYWRFYWPTIGDGAKTNARTLMMLYSQSTYRHWLMGLLEEVIKVSSLKRISAAINFHQSSIKPLLLSLYFRCFRGEWKDPNGNTFLVVLDGVVWKKVSKLLYTLKKIVQIDFDFWALCLMINGNGLFGTFFTISLLRFPSPAIILPATTRT